jgi:nicotinamide N-methyltransferase
MIIAADTLWNIDGQQPFLDSILDLLKQPHALSYYPSRVLLVAGLHTGRYALQRFIRLAEAVSLRVVELRERRVYGEEERSWAVDRDGEDESARKQWLVWMILHMETEKSNVRAVES